jgi:large conductance mechanosensitive channel
MFKEFRNFLLRGNVIDLAVAVVIGAAFGVLIASLTKNLLTPLIAIPGKVNFGKWIFTISGSDFYPGRFLNDVFAFILTAAAVFFFVVKPVNVLMEKRKTQPNVESPTKQCPECLSNIPMAARKCAFCTTTLAA